MGRKTITVSEGTYEMLDRNKPDGVTWDKHLTDLQYATDAEEGGVGDLRPFGGEVPEGFLEIHDATEEQLAIVREKLENVPERTADEVEGRLR